MAGTLGGAQASFAVAWLLLSALALCGASAGGGGGGETFRTLCGDEGY